MRLRCRPRGPGAATGCNAPSSTNACIIDYTLAQAFAGGVSASKSGYVFKMGAAAGAGGGPNITFVAGAAPLSYNQSGVRRFCSVEDAVLRFDPNTAASTTPESVEATCQSATYTVLQ